MTKRKSMTPYTDPTSIGNLAIEKGYATKEQVDLAVKKQEERQPLGMILVEQGILTEVQLAELLIDQESRRGRLGPTQVSALWRDQKRKKVIEVMGAFHGLSAALHEVSKG